MSELLPCPFCGSEAIVHEVRLIPAGSRWEIHCKEIAGCGINQKGFLTKEAAMVQWNIRCRPSPWVKAQGVKYCGRCGKCLDNACCECEEASQ